MAMAGQKAAATRKRRTAAKKAAKTRKRREARRKAAATRVRKHQDDSEQPDNSRSNETLMLTSEPLLERISGDVGSNMGGGSETQKCQTTELAV